MLVRPDVINVSLLTGCYRFLRLLLYRTGHQ
jgi:hypothetical protein